MSDVEETHLSYVFCGSSGVGRGEMAGEHS